MKTLLKELKELPPTKKLLPAKKRLLLTGGLGFVGSHICEGVLRRTDWEVVILDKYTYAGNANRLVDMECWKDEKHRVKIIYHDLRAPISETISKMIGKIDYIFHLAAESHVQRSLENSIPFVESAVLGTANLLEWVKHEQFNLEKYIGFNTDECFGPAPSGVNYKETDKFYPSNPYSGAKAGQWCIEYAFAHSFELPILQTHSMNIIGERQDPEKFIPMTIRKILKKEIITIHGSKENSSVRKWIHAREVCNGLLFLIENGKIGETYNIVGEEWNVLEITHLISQYIKGKELEERQIEYLDFHRTRKGHDFRYSLDGDKLANLGWVPCLDFKFSLKKTIGWSIRPENLRWLNL